MTGETGKDPMEALRRANPVPPDEVKASPEELAVARERALEAGEGTTAAPAPHGTRARVAGGIAVAAGLAAVAVFAFGGGSPVETDIEQAFAGEAIAVAEANPRVLIEAPGWEVAEAGEFEADHGSMRFRNDEQELTLDWYRAPDEYAVPEGRVRGELPQLDQWYEFDEGVCADGNGPEPCREFARDTEVSMIGRGAVLSEYRLVTPDESSSRFSVELPPVDRTYLSMYLTGIPLEEIEPLLGSFVQVDVEEWLSALPPKTVKPLERPEVIDEMLADVPIPETVDIEALKGDVAVASGRYGLGATVTSAVACGWLDQWAAAVEDGDEAAAREAVEAMSTSTEWDILKEMNEEGGWSQTIWEYAGEMRRDERQQLLGSSGTESAPDGRIYELRPGYATGIGCDSQKRILVEDPPRYARPFDLSPVEAPAPPG